MVPSFITEWSKEARFGWDRMPAEVQAGVSRLLGQMMASYGVRYRALGDPTKALQTKPHLFIPEWNIWLRLQAHYQEDELGPILFIYVFEELTKNEFEQSRAGMKKRPAD